MEPSQGHPVVVLLLADGLDGVLAAVTPAAVQLGCGSMAEQPAWTHVEQARLQLRLPGPRMVAQSEDVHLQPSDATGLQPVAELFLCHAASTRLSAHEDTVLRDAEHGNDFLYLSWIHDVFHT